MVKPQVSEEGHGLGFHGRQKGRQGAGGGFTDRGRGENGAGFCGCVASVAEERRGEGDGGKREGEGCGVVLTDRGEKEEEKRGVWRGVHAQTGRERREREKNGF